MERGYKHNSVQKSNEGRRELRAYRKSIERKQLREDKLMKGRNLAVISETTDIDEPIGNAAVKRGTASTRTKKNGTVPSVPKGNATKESDEERRQRLQKYKEQKMLKKKLEQKNTKPVFKVTRVVHSTKPFEDPFAPLPSLNRGKIQNQPTENRRVTRAMAARNDEKLAVEVVGRKTKKRVLPPHTSLPIPNKTVKLQEIPDDTTVQETKKVAAATRRSFAPDNFVFKPPKELSHVFPKPSARTSENNFVTVFSFSGTSTRLEPSAIPSTSKIDRDKQELDTAELPDSSEENEAESAANTTYDIQEDEPNFGGDQIEDENMQSSKDGLGPAVIASGSHPLTDDTEAEGNYENLNSERAEQVDREELQLPVEKPAEDLLNGSFATQRGDNEDSQFIGAATPKRASPVVDDKVGSIPVIVAENVFKTPVFPAVCSGKSEKELFSRLENSPWITTTRGSSSGSRRKRSLNLSASVRTSEMVRNLDADLHEAQLEQSKNEDIVVTQLQATSPQASVLETDTQKREKIRFGAGAATSPPLETVADWLQENTPDSSQPTGEVEAIADVTHFEKIVASHEETLSVCISHWENIIDTSDIPERALGQVQSTVGLTRLLLNQRFKQFKRLIDDCKYKRGEKETTCEDLQGFWDMIFLQIEDVQGKLAELEELKGRSWEFPPSAKRPKRRKGTKPKVKKTAASSKIKQMITANRMAKVNIPSMETVSTLNTEKVFTPSIKNVVTRRSSISQSSRKRSVSFQGDVISNSSPIRTSTKKSDCTPSSLTKPTRKSARLSTILKHTGVSGNDNENITPTPGSVKQRWNVRFSLAEDDSEEDLSTQYRRTPFSKHRGTNKVQTSSSSDSPGSHEFSDVEQNPCLDTSFGLTNTFAGLALKSPTPRKTPKNRKSSILSASKTATPHNDLICFSPLTPIENIKRRTRSGTKSIDCTLRTPDQSMTVEARLSRRCALRLDRV